MRALIQRVTHAAVSSEGTPCGSIGKGFAILLGVAKGDGPEEAAYVAHKTANMRIFPDEAGKLNLSLKDVGGEALVVSQFTLYADTSRGNRPGFTMAAEPAVADELYELYVKLLKEEGIPVQTGVFRTDMLVEIANDGPTTIILESKEKV